VQLAERRRLDEYPQGKRRWRPGPICDLWCVSASNGGGAS